MKVQKDKKELINFYAPSIIKDRFDAVCYQSGYTRTSGLLYLMSKFIIERGLEIANENLELAKIDENLTPRPKIATFKEFINADSSVPPVDGSEMPVGFVSGGDNDWDLNSISDQQS